ncbi:MAG: lasso peptide biosynthesis B2 protein, partial [Gaiellaceae bacterium]
MSPKPLSRRLTTIWLAARMMAWSFALPVLKRMVPLPKLARLMSASRSVARDTIRERQAIVWARRVDRLRPRRFRGNCLERSLLAYRFLGMTGSNPRLVVGFESGARGIAGHAWVVVDGTPLYG